MRRKFFSYVVIFSSIFISNILVLFYSSYIFSLRHKDHVYLSEVNSSEIFAILVVPDNGQWDENKARDWFKKPKDAEWMDEVTDRYFVKWSPETTGHVAYGFRLKKVNERYSVVSR